MTEKEKALVRRAMESGHICWQCPEDHDGPCPGVDEAWEILRKAVQPKTSRRTVIVKINRFLKKNPPRKSK
jgi:hypothetical protein